MHLAGARHPLVGNAQPIHAPRDFLDSGLALRKKHAEWMLRSTERHNAPIANRLYRGHDAIRACRSLMARGEKFYVSEVIPLELVTLQGILFRDTYGLALEYSTRSGLLFRQAMRHPLHAVGLRAIGMLQMHLDTRSFTHIMELMSHGDIRVEFAAHRVPVGYLGWNTVIWEIEGELSL